MIEKFLNGFRELKIPLLDKNNCSAWPERFSVKKIDSLRSRIGQNIFATQMLLELPDKKTKAFFDVELLDFYTESLIYREANHKAILSLGDVRLVNGIAFWDPSLGREKSDGSVVACVFQDEKGFYYLHQISYLKVERSSHSAQEQCDAVVQMLKENFLNTLVIETNGIGGFLPELFKERCRKAQYPVAIKTVHSRIQKSERIVSTLDPLFSSGFLKCNSRVKTTPFLKELINWFPDSSHAKDDGMDALCGAIMSEPVRIRTLPTISTFNKVSWKR